jgi:hypothetical protein
MKAHGWHGAAPGAAAGHQQPGPLVNELDQPARPKGLVEANKPTTPAELRLDGAGHRLLIFRSASHRCAMAPARHAFTRQRFLVAGVLKAVV